MRPIDTVTSELTLTRSRYMADGEFPREYDDVRFETEHDMLVFMQELEREHARLTAALDRIEHELYIAHLRFTMPKQTLDYSRAAIFPVKYSSLYDLMLYILEREEALNTFGPARPCIE